MIKKLVRQMLAAQILSALTVSLCLLIDSIMIGKFLGVEAIAAYGLANPILLVIGAIGSMLSAGIQVVCSRSLGKGSQEETNQGYSSAIAVAACVSFLFAATVLILRKPLASLLGAGNDGPLFNSTNEYMAGFVIGAPGSMGALILVPFLQMAGQNNLLIAAVAGMTVADIVFDLLNVLVFNGGMFGMGLASSLSYYIALLIGAIYLLSKKCVFRFSFRRISMKKIRELFSGGVPTVFNMASTVILTFVLNKILLAIGGDEGSAAVAAYTVMTTILNASNCISTGVGGVSLTLSGILFNEEDRTGLRELLRCMIKAAVLLGLGVGIILLIFAPAFVSLFISRENGATWEMTVLGVRILAGGLIPCCMNNILKSIYQGIGRPLTTEIISMLEGAAFPILTAVILCSGFGPTGTWFYFAGGEILALISILVFAFLRNRRKHHDAMNAILLLNDDFGVPQEDMIETDIQSLRAVSEASETAGKFCLDHGQSPIISNRIALCVEEMAGNTVSHGFSKDNKPHHLGIRIQTKNDKWVIRFRDDCNAFDPVHYIPDETKAGCTGIRLVLNMADEVRYTYSMNLNNLTVMLIGQKNDMISEG